MANEFLVVFNYGVDFKDKARGDFLALLWLVFGSELAGEDFLG